MIIHASSVSLTNRAVLLQGASGIGKSDLALRLIDEGATLISDDQTLLHCEDNGLVASPPPSIEGLLEVRNVGIIKISFLKAIRVALVVELTNLDTDLERLPDPDSISFFDHAIPRLKLPAFAASTPAKIRTFLTFSQSLLAP